MRAKAGNAAAPNEITFSDCENRDNLCSTTDKINLLVNNESKFSKKAKKDKKTKNAKKDKKYKKDKKDKKKRKKLVKTYSEQLDTSTRKNNIGKLLSKIFAASFNVKVVGNSVYVYDKSKGMFVISNETAVSTMINS